MASTQLCGGSVLGRVRNRKLRNPRISYNIRMKCMLAGALGVLLLSCVAVAQDYPPEEFPAQLPTKAQPSKAQMPKAPTPSDNPPPRPLDNSQESSSKDTKIDLTPPKGDDIAHPTDGTNDGSGLRPFNPHKAQKDVEIGDFYFKKENYAAALSRYQEALSWKPDDADAHFKLGQTYEKLGRLQDARSNYESYLKILPQGPHSAQATKALQKLPKAPGPASSETSQASAPEVQSSSGQNLDKNQAR